MFDNRQQAGRALAAAILQLAADDPAFVGERVVIALPRGGVPVAAEIAKAMVAPLDLVMVRKIGVPWQPELAAAAVVDGPEPLIVRNEAVIRATGLTEGDIAVAAEAELVEIERRRALYLAGRERLPIEGRVVIVVDDGVATGSTARAALEALRRRDPRTLILAVPVGSRDGLEAIRAVVDRLVVLNAEHPFQAVGMHYKDFAEVTDAEVRATLAATDRLQSGTGVTGARGSK